MNSIRLGSFCQQFGEWNQAWDLLHWMATTCLHILSFQRWLIIIYIGGRLLDYLRMRVRLERSHETCRKKTWCFGDNGNWLWRWKTIIRPDSREVASFCMCWTQGTNSRLKNQHLVGPDDMKKLFLGHETPRSSFLRRHRECKDCFRFHVFF